MTGRVLLLALAIAALPSAANADSATATMAVSLKVEPACAVATEPMVFAGQAGSAIWADTKIAVKCSVDTPVSVTLDGGAHAQGTQRHLAGAEGMVAYDLYSDAGRSILWAPGAPRSAQAAVGATLELAAYGAIPGARTLAATGDYRDTVVVRVDF